MNFVNSPSFQSSDVRKVEAVRVNPIARSMPFSLANTTLEQDLVVARTIAKLMDSQFALGPVKFGLDSIIGLIPAAGDAITFAIGLYPIHVARKHKLGKALIGRMLLNLGADFLVGIVPIVGDAADVAFKAQLMNLALLEKAAAKCGVVLPA